jgi:hypothetical protein
MGSLRSGLAHFEMLDRVAGPLPTGSSADGIPTNTKKKKEDEIVLTVSLAPVNISISNYAPPRSRP